MDTVEINKKQVAEYIRNQLAGDQIAYQTSLEEYVNSFTGSENKEV